MSKPPHASPDALFAEASWVHRLARHLIRDEHLAADVAQDALLAGMSAPVPATAEPRGWLVGTVRRLAQQALRRRAQHAALIPAGDARFLSVVGDGEYRLFGEEAQTPWDKLTRCDAATAAWRTCVGDWQIDPQFGTAATIALDGDRLRLSLRGGWPEGLEIVPVGADQAMVMAMPDFGTRLRRDGDDLVWARADGRTISMRRGQ